MSNGQQDDEELSIQMFTTGSEEGGEDSTTTYSDEMFEPIPIDNIVNNNNQDNGGNNNNTNNISIDFGSFFDQHNFFSNIEGFLMPSRSTKRKRKSQNKKQVGVRFACDAIVHQSTREEVEEEISSCWYSKEELSVFKQERKIVIRALKRVSFDLSAIDTSILCLRGLEAYLSVSFNKLMQSKRTEVMHSVLTEQARQRALGFRVLDAEQLRSVCRGVTEWARERALELGFDDAKQQGFPVPESNSDTASNSDDPMAAWGHDTATSLSLPSVCATECSTSPESSPDVSRLRKSLPEALSQLQMPLDNSSSSFNDVNFEPLPLYNNYKQSDYQQQQVQQQYYDYGQTSNYQYQQQQHYDHQQQPNMPCNMSQPSAAAAASTATATTRDSQSTIIGGLDPSLAGMSGSESSSHYQLL